MKDLDRLLNYYAAGRIFLPRPRFLCFNATLACDGRCGHCGIWQERERGRELTPTELAEVLSGPLFSEVETAWITGGEPTLREDIGDIARAMTDSLPSLVTLGIATNGLDPDRVLDRVGAMAEAATPGRHRLFAHLSLDGVGLVHDRARGRPGAFEAVSETISRLKELAARRPEAGIEIGLNCVIQPDNILGLAELFGFSRRHGLQLMFNVVLVTDRIYRNAGMASSLSFSNDDRERLLDFFARIMPESPAPFRYQYNIIREVISGRPRPRRCLTLFTTININADGSLIPCPAASDLLPKNVLEEDMEALWRGPEAAALRVRIRREFCASCMLSCSLGDSMPLIEWLRGGWDKAGRP